MVLQYYLFVADDLLLLFVALAMSWPLGATTVGRSQKRRANSWRITPSTCESLLETLAETTRFFGEIKEKYGVDTAAVFHCAMALPRHQLSVPVADPLQAQAPPHCQ